MLLERTHRKSNYQIPMQMGSWEAKTGVTTRSGFENTQLSSFIITGLLHRGKRSNSNHGLYGNTNDTHAYNLVHTNKYLKDSNICRLCSRSLSRTSIQHLIPVIPCSNLLTSNDKRAVGIWGDQILRKIRESSRKTGGQEIFRTRQEGQTKKPNEQNRCSV